MLNYTKNTCLLSLSNNRMNQKRIIYVICIVLIAGPSFVGWGIGKLFSKQFEGISIGIGMGLLLLGLFLTKILYRMLIYNKDKIE